MVVVCVALSSRRVTHVMKVVVVLVLASVVNVEVVFTNLKGAVLVVALPETFIVMLSEVSPTVAFSNASDSSSGASGSKPSQPASLTSAAPEAADVAAPTSPDCNVSSPPIAGSAAAVGSMAVPEPATDTVAATAA